MYGPVPSWRFGRSLGIDVITPPKKCTFNCIYCQLGRTKLHISGPEGLKKNLVTPVQVLDDLKATLKRIDLNTVDIVTFSGRGEPTLNLQLDSIAKEVKPKIGSIPLAILTNSSLLHKDKIRRSLCQFDVVVAKLDAGDDATFRLINRPADDKLDLDTIVDSIKKVRREFEGALALEVMLLSTKNRQVTNVEGRPLKRLMEAILDVKPELVQLDVPYRPTSESFVRQPSRERVKVIYQELAEFLGEAMLWVYGLHDKRGKQVEWLSHISLEIEALDLLKRRPCRVVDISESLGIDLSVVSSILTKLVGKGSVLVKVSNEERYYSYRSLK